MLYGIYYTILHRDYLVHTRFGSFDELLKRTLDVELSQREYAFCDTHLIRVLGEVWKKTPPEMRFLQEYLSPRVYLQKKAASQAVTMPTINSLYAKSSLQPTTFDVHVVGNIQIGRRYTQRTLPGILYMQIDWRSFSTSVVQLLLWCRCVCFCSSRIFVVFSSKTKISYYL